MTTLRDLPLSSPRPSRATPVLFLLCCVQFLLVLDVTVVNVAVPEMRADLALTAAQAQWALSAYLVPFGALLLTGGRLGDRFGRRRVLLVGLTLFALGNLLAALSTGFAELVSARALTGVGAAAASPSALALLVTCFPSGPAHARAFAAWGGVGASGAAVGVLLGGALTSGLGWRAVFAIAVPVSLPLIVLAPRLLPAARPVRPRALDLPGAVLTAVAAGACLLALGRTAELGWRAAEVHLWHTLATVAVVLLWLHLRRASDPLVPLDLLRRRSVLTGTTLMACAAGTLICAFLLCSLLLQERLGHSALRTGLEFLPAAVATVVTARAAARVLGTWGSRRVAVLALAVAGAGAVALAVVADAGPVPVVLALALLASGVGAVFVIAGTTIMSGMGQGEAGVLAGLSTTAHELGAGAVLALALAVAIVADGVDLPAGFLSLAVVVAVALGAAVAGLRPTDGIGARGGFVH
jgi:MFS family permease